MATTGAAGAAAGGPSGTTTSSPTGSASGTATAAPTGKPGGEDGFGYTPWGPDDPPIPGQYAGFTGRSDDDLDCAGVRDQRPAASGEPGGDFWDVAIGVCEVLRGGGRWPEATAVPGPPAGDNDYQACLNGELAAMLDRALTWHRSNPGRHPEIDYPARSSSPCQRRLYGVEALSVDAAEEALSDLGPAGQVAVRFGVATGPDDREPTATATVAGTQTEALVDFSETGFARLAVFFAPAAEEREVTLTVDNGRGPIVETVTLPAVEAPTTEPPVTTEPPATTEPPPTTEPSATTEPPATTATTDD